MPLVSVVIATYGRPDLLSRAVGTALAQTMADLEVVVVVENGDAPSIVALAAIGDPRVRCVTNRERRGPARARDTGAAASAGQWLAFLDDDDEWLPDKLEKQLASVSGRANTISTTLSRVVTPLGDWIWPTVPYDDAEPIDEWLFGRRSWTKGGQSMLQTSSLLVPRSLFEHLGFGEAFHEEWELVIRAVKQFGFRVVTVPEPLVVYYAGHAYPWEQSAAWIESMRDIITPRAYAGFCLTVAARGLASPGRNRAFVRLLRMATTRGRPTAKQLFAFALNWVLPQPLRQRVRVALSRRSRSFVKPVQLSPR